MDHILEFSEDFVISAGTVPVDIPERVILLIYHRSKHEYMLPKGRKHVGDILEATATRETYEETGYGCRLLKHKLPTRATRLETEEHAESFAVQQRMSGGVRKIIFWYLAKVDSTSEQKLGTQEEGEDFEVYWASFEDASAKMTFKDDSKIVEKALEAVASISSTQILPDTGI